MTRAQRARMEPLVAERIASGIFAVRNRQSGRCYRVNIRKSTCEGADFQYTVGSSGACKHLKFIEQISTGTLCPACGYAICRPSCPERRNRTADVVERAVGAAARLPDTGAQPIQPIQQVTREELAPAQRATKATTKTETEPEETQ